MNDQTAPTLSRRQRFDRQHENQEHPKKEPRPKSHGGLVVLLVLLSLVLLASAPVYGLVKNSPKMVKTTSSSNSSKKTSQSATSSASSQSSDATSAAQSSTSQSATSASQSESAAQSSQSQAAQSSDDQAAASAAAANTATLGANQTLYNFAVTHGTTTDQIYALNPGVTAQNYSKFAGQALRIK
ncbi:MULTISPECIES: LysM domain-containing protein [Fructobacillus]|jgi:cytoskeletal protein RodZ|uniref:LysM repeat (LysM) n=1 Tax=Fructobacillus cardui TaxID=2893170 RepID=A0ABM9MX47_9LACO|nr:LysM domain-containing protein [Fructobacillus sp. EFB-N1]KMK53899.1 cell division protein ZipA [Fructobacillus sp. EFB-N1]CAK1223980.1 LysM repeat (LysM) [Fructobacillus cardui]CAK1246458.1 LysM repeat (LysM) [Fructobacillus cardui]CAK1251641.1 LysM repeat (LysM) [Fructobacillus cardui]